MRNCFIATCLSTLMLSQSGNANPLPLPAPLKYVEAKDEQEYPLGSTCTFFPIRDKSQFIDSELKNRSICNKNGSSRIPTFDKRNIEQYINVSIRDMSKDSTTILSQDSSLSVPEVKGIAAVSATGNIKYRNYIDTRTSVVDLTYIMSPYQRFVDGNECKFSEFDEVEENDLRFNFIKKGFFSNKVRSLSPCEEVKDASDVLLLAGSSVVSKHYFGIAYTASVRIDFKSSKAKTDFESNIAMKLNDGSCDIDTKLKKEISKISNEQIDSISVQFYNHGLNNFTGILKKNGSGNVEAFESFRQHEKDIVSHATQKNLGQVVLDISSLLTDLNNINDSIVAILPQATQQSYSLQSVLKRVILNQDVSVGLTAEQASILDMFPVIAVGTSTHAEVISIGSENISTLNRAVNLAFNKYYCRQSIAEKKCKVGKI